MMNRRGFVLSLTTGLVALVLVVGSVLAEELVGTIIKVDADAKLIVVVPKDSDKEIKVKVTDKTELVTKKGTRKLDLEKLEKNSRKPWTTGRRESRPRSPMRTESHQRLSTRRRRKRPSERTMNRPASPADPCSSLRCRVCQCPGRHPGLVEESEAVACRAWPSSLECGIWSAEWGTN